MNEIDRLVAAFRSEDTSSLSDPDRQSHKVEIILELEDHSSDPKVLAFLLELADDIKQYDLARIEAFKILYVRQIAQGSEPTRIGSVIATVLLNEEDDLDVRHYAAIAAASYMMAPKVDEAVEKIVLNSQADFNLRMNAFEGIERNGRTSKGVRIVQAYLFSAPAVAQVGVAPGFRTTGASG